MAEYHEGESEDIWMNQAILMRAQREVASITERQNSALQRRFESTNPVSTLIASVAVFTSGRSIAKARDRLEFAQQLPQPSESY